jgi:putative membrane protein
MALLDREGERRVAEAIERVERGTNAELVTVLAPRADDYLYIPTLWAALLALLVPWALKLAPLWLVASDLLLAQAGTFVGLTLLLRWRPVLFRLVPRSVQVWRASSLARRQFLEQNLHHTEGETGVLVFVSEAERYVEILADRGVSRHVPDELWQSIVDGFTARVREGRTVDGFLECVDACGALLARHVPATHTRNELPDRLVVLGRD